MYILVDLFLFKRKWESNRTIQQFNNKTIYKLPPPSKAILL
jgi:hypothetical protein